MPGGTGPSRVIVPVPYGHGDGAPRRRRVMVWNGISWAIMGVNGNEPDCLGISAVCLGRGQWLRGRLRSSPRGCGSGLGGGQVFTVCSCCAAGAKPGQAACKPGSVRGVATPGRPFVWDVRRRTPRATYPGGTRGNAPAACTRGRNPGGFRRPPLFGLAPGGVCRAVPVAGAAVRSCRTVSPLPTGLAACRRSVLCGTVPGVAPAGRYPAPCSRGARTFLTPRPFGGGGRGRPAA